MYKKCQVILLPTTEKSILFIGKISGQLHDLAIPDSDSSTLNQNLYIVSKHPEGELIKVGDWYIDDTFAIRIANTSDEDYWSRRPNYKKIIASTDVSFHAIKFRGTKKLEAPSKVLKGVAVIPKSFIDKYIVEYNRGNKITDIFVEYNSSDDNLDGYVSMFGGVEVGNTLKINDDNTINIKSTKESWDREEVIELINKAIEFVVLPSTDNELKDLNKWINENL